MLYVRPTEIANAIQAEKIYHANVKRNHEYLPIAGIPDFTSAAQKLVLGAESPAIRESRVRENCGLRLSITSNTNSTRYVRSKRSPVLERCISEPHSCRSFSHAQTHRPYTYLRQAGPPTTSFSPMSISQPATIPTSTEKRGCSISTASPPTYPPPREAASSYCTRARTIQPASTQL